MPHSQIKIKQKRIKKLVPTRAYWKSLPHTRYMARQMFVHDLGITLTDPNARKLITYCRAHHKLCEYACNGSTREKLKNETWPEYQTAANQQMDWVARRIKVTEIRIAKLCKDLGIFCYFQKDPRGHTCKFQKAPFLVVHGDSYVNTTNARGADTYNW